MATAPSLHIVRLDDQPARELRYLNAARGGGTEVTRLGLQLGTARGIPDGVDALVVTSDLQGIVPDPHTRESTLLGVAVAAWLEELGDEGVIPRTVRCGALLAGDLYSVPAANKRGGYGDVSDVWAAFADRFAWVVGVAGNHDDVSAVNPSDDVRVLDGERTTRGGLHIGGVSLVSGNPAKPGRRDEDEQLAHVDLVTEGGLDLLVLHEGPHGGDDQPGHAAVRALVERRVALTVCGHVHWPRALATTERGQILNVDARVVVLARAR